MSLMEVPREKIVTEKCAHPACKCVVPSEGGQYGKYCSEHCREAKDTAEIRCDCKHPACN